jgi:Ni/Co efflux regulator RcnB
MKRILLAAVAGLMLASPVAVAPAFAQHHDDNDHHDNNGRDNNGPGHHGNNDWRDDRHDARYDPSQHNGYYIGKTWHQGQPPASAYHQKGFQLGYRHWAKGQRLGEFNHRYREVDYRQHHLAPPKRGYHYVEDDHGDIILAAVATGLIAAIIAANN